MHGETFDHEMRRLETAEVERALADAGFTVQRRSGIRCVMDLVADDGIKADPEFYRQLLELELDLCERSLTGGPRASGS